MLNPDKLFAWLMDQGLQPDMVEEDTEIIICCPICDDDRPRLYINADTGAWVCFHCHEEGGLQRFFLAAMGLGGGDAYEMASEMRDEEGEEYFEVVERARAKKRAPPDKALVLPDQYHGLDEEGSEPYLEYLVRRKIDPFLAHHLDIGWAASGRYAHRLIVPVFRKNDDGIPVLYTFIARTLLTECPNCKEELDECICRPFKYPKVLTPRQKDGARPSRTVYNYDMVARSTTKRLIVMEGWADCLRRPDEAVALMGSSASADQRQLIANLGKGRRVIIALDSDSAGYTGAMKLADHLTAEMLSCYVALLPEGHDPGELSDAELEACLNDSRRYVL